MIEAKNIKRARLAEVLHNSGYKTAPILRTCKYPVASKIRISASSENASQSVVFRNGNNETSVKSGVFTSINTIGGSVSSEASYDGVSDWSIGRPLVEVKFNDGGYRKVFFGEKRSGVAGSSGLTKSDQSALPGPPNWPKLSFVESLD